MDPTSNPFVSDSTSPSVVTIYPNDNGWAVKRDEQQLAVLPSRIDAEAFAVLAVKGDCLIRIFDSDGAVSGELRRTVKVRDLQAG